VGLKQIFPERFRYYQVDVDDDPEENLLQYLPKCFEFINEGIANGSVLVHCAAGVSRSATVVIAYLMATTRIDFTTAFWKVKKARGIIYPNQGFIEQLKLFQEMGYCIDFENDKYKDISHKGRLKHEAISIASSEDSQALL